MNDITLTFKTSLALADFLATFNKDAFKSAYVTEEVNGTFILILELF